MTIERAKDLAEALTVDRDVDDTEDYVGFGVHYYPDGEYVDEVTVEIAEALKELVKIKAKYNLE